MYIQCTYYGYTMDILWTYYGYTMDLWWVVGGCHEDLSRIHAECDVIPYPITPTMDHRYCIDLLSLKVPYSRTNRIYCTLAIVV